MFLQLQSLYREFEASRESLAGTLTRCSDLTTDLNDCKTALMTVNAEKNELLSVKSDLESRIGELNALVESLREDAAQLETKYVKNRLCFASILVLDCSVRLLYFNVVFV